MKYLFRVIIVGVLFFVFRDWFSSLLLTSTDFHYPFFYSYDTVSLFPYVWDLQRNAGMGGFYGIFLWDHFLVMLPIGILGKVFHLDWRIVERLVFFFPFLFYSLLSTFLLGQKILKDRTYALLAALLYTENSYILMIVAGGQMQIALAYGLLPLAFFQFFRVSEKISERVANYYQQAVILGVVLAIQGMYDVRITYITIVGMAFYALIHFLIRRSVGKVQGGRIFLGFCVTIGIFALLHLFWVIPSILHGTTSIDTLGSAFSTTEAVKFFSFAKFENSFSLLHPNWPHNIFGRVDFFNPLFLIFPLFAFASIFFLSKKQTAKEERITVLFFALLGLLGVFLAKGANDPLAGVYLWLFHNMPGFSLFRDASKWYGLIALSYAILISYSLYQISTFVKTYREKSVPFVSKNAVFLSKIIVILSLFFLLLPLFPAISGQISGTLKGKNPPEAYQQLANFLINEKSFGRVLWIPNPSRFAYYSVMHPEVPAEEFFHVTSLDETLSILKRPSTEVVLRQSSVRYVILPFDSEKEIFLTDRKYDPQKYLDTDKKLLSIPWLHKTRTFGNMHVFEISGSKDRFWESEGGSKISWQMISPTHYKINTEHDKISGRVAFSETFDANWVARVNGITIPSRLYKGQLNSFVIPLTNETVDISFSPQGWEKIALLVSGCALCLVIISLLLLRRR